MSAYKWKIGTRHKTDAEVAARVMNRLASEQRLNAETLVNVSRPEDAPLHDEFEWRDGVAAENWRMHQARNLINAIVVIDEDTLPQEQPRAFYTVSVTTPNYEPISEIKASIEKSGALQTKALRELKAYRDKYRTVMRQCGAEYEMEKLIEKLEESA